MVVFLVSIVARAIGGSSLCRADLVIENLALRREVAVLNKSATGDECSMTPTAPSGPHFATRGPVGTWARPRRHRVEAGSIPPLLDEDVSTKSKFRTDLASKESPGRWHNRLRVHRVYTVSSPRSVSSFPRCRRRVRGRAVLQSPTKVTEAVVRLLRNHKDNIAVGFRLARNGPQFGFIMIRPRLSFR